MNYRKIKKTFLIVSSGRAVDISLTFINNIILTAILSISEVGVYFLLLSIVLFLSSVSRFGVGRASVRLIAEFVITKEHGKANIVAILSLAIGLIVSSFIAYLLQFEYYYGSVSEIFKIEVLGYLLMISSLWIIALTIQTLVSEIFKGHGLFAKATFFGGVFTRILTTIFLVYLSLLETSSIQEVVGLSILACYISTLLSVLILWLGSGSAKYLSKNINTWTFFNSGTKSLLWNLISISWPIWLSGIASFGLIQSGILIVGIYHGESVAATYGIAERLVTFVAMPMIIINAVVPPMIIKMTLEKEKSDLEKIIRVISTIAFLMSIILFSIYFFFGEIIIERLFGSQYQDAYIILLILGFGRVFYMATGASESVLLMTGHQLVFLFVTLISALIAIFGSIYFSTYYQVYGIAASYSIAMIFERLVFLYLVKIKQGFWTHFSIGILAREINLKVKGKV